jgi:hypothetical protein
MLTELQRRFAYQVANNHDLKAAADFVGIDEQTALDWFAEKEISEIIVADRIAAAAAITETKERCIARLANWANVDPGDYFIDNGVSWSLKPPNMLTKAQRQCIKGIRETKDGISLTFHDAMKANADMAAMNGWLEAASDGGLRPEDWASTLRELAGAMEQVSGASETTD